ncbi:hypothetical protein EI94DRAFT_1109739 [Lactarius quietus]|nr:hypothetical protein EI94DRAFT_1109739 [Lactarius quietus]
MASFNSSPSLQFSDVSDSQSSTCLHRQHPLFYPSVHFASLREPIRDSSRSVNRTVALLIALQLPETCLSIMEFGSVFMYTSSAPANNRSLGATNGIAQTVVSIQRLIGPAAVASLYLRSHWTTISWEETLHMSWRSPKGELCWPSLYSFRINHGNHEE